MQAQQIITNVNFLGWKWNLSFPGSDFSFAF